MFFIHRFCDPVVGLYEPTPGVLSVPSNRYSSNVSFPSMHDILSIPDPTKTPEQTSLFEHQNQRLLPTQAPTLAVALACAATAAAVA